MRLAAGLILTITLAFADDLGDQLLAAARKSDVSAAKALLDKGADVNARTRYNQTPLFFACDRGSLEMAALLIERGADLNAKDNFYNATPMTWAMEKKNNAMVMLLIEKGVDPADALMDSIKMNKKDLFQTVLEKGKTTPAMLSDALQLADSMKRDEMSSALKAKGAVLKTFDVDPATLSDYAGTYSDGASLTLEAAVKDGKLVMTQSGFSMTGTPSAKDEFKLVAQGISLKFVRGADGKVVSMKIPGRGGDMELKKTAGGKQ